MLKAGVNPFALDCHNKTQLELCNVSVRVPENFTSDLFFSTTSLHCVDRNFKKPCNGCTQHLTEPWYYKNGRIVDFKFTDMIGRGGEGTVFQGKFHGRDAAFKLVKIKNSQLTRYTPDSIDDLNKRLSETKKLSNTNAQNILPFFGHIR